MCLWQVIYAYIAFLYNVNVILSFLLSFIFLLLVKSKPYFSCIFFWLPAFGQEEGTSSPVHAGQVISLLQIDQ